MMGNATNCLTMGRNRHRPAVLKSVECAKSCMDSWLWLNGTQMAIDWQKCVNWPWVQTISVLGSWPIAKPFQKAYFWSSRLERLVQPHHCLDKKVGWTENSQYLKNRQKNKRRPKKRVTVTISLCWACWFSSSTAITLWFNFAIWRRIIWTWKHNQL